MLLEEEAEPEDDTGQNGVPGQRVDPAEPLPYGESFHWRNRSYPLDPRPHPPRMILGVALMGA